MDFKAYGMTATLNEDNVTLVATSRIARGAMSGETERVIYFKDISFLFLAKGNLFVNHRIIIGEARGKSYVPVVPWKDNYRRAEVFYNSLYEAVTKDHDISGGVEPKNLRSDRMDAMRVHLEELKAEEALKEQAKLNYKKYIDKD